eukprot:CAMPEP_0204115784 /NCGR_PEP_ID=MMETSP0361-20130328/5027_1 /ASSEMBLY_ACC=CAM_ASM_000343 /TAXON_ID=268821 /ORGANISM="Scrippsiella Hangoei, Strain SHTV-5" /LENGTH=100 /DNA_ID=CAMNT_0051066485 /DNA_START=108 /DNA_END=411 /DNA_ORIENTATION=+
MTRFVNGAEVASGLRKDGGQVSERDDKGIVTEDECRVRDARSTAARVRPGAARRSTRKSDRKPRGSGCEVQSARDGAESSRGEEEEKDFDDIRKEQNEAQ